MLRQPPHDGAHYIILFVFGQPPAGFDPVPFQKAGAAARRGRMLRDKHRMSPPRRLLAVIARFGWGKTLRDQITRVRADPLLPALLKIASFFGAQSES